jgi:2-polyprenyl-3-methyl-5-hydroxy-6-metoxy-1,4-benzoquinol methylase
MVDRPEEERGVDYYNAVYTQEGPRHYSCFMLYPIWQEVGKMLESRQDRNILEIGCGSGGLAHYLHDLKYDKYTGFDFSKEAINIAEKRVCLPFFVGDALDPKNYEGGYDTAILIEVLEHINEDLKVLKNIRPGTEVVFSVPNVKCSGHTRFFPNISCIKERYNGIIDINKTEMFTLFTAKWFVCKGVRVGESA